MSGIFGFQQLNTERQVSWMEDLSHWNRLYGDEGSDTLLLGSAGLGCHLEHLSDRFAATAPVIRRGSLAAVVDAVLYNREELLADVHGDDTLSDEELLLRYLEAKGFDSLAGVNGDFAGAIYDAKQDRWVLFRDHSGVRPLFYYMKEDSFAFSTDLRGLTALSGVDHSINEEKLFLRTMGYNDLTLCRTDYEHICCIRPAAWTEIRRTDSGFEKTEHIYWTWRSRKIRLGSDEAYQQELRRLITDAIRRRLEAFPGPAGCELSGGMDSSVIAILINRLGREGCYYSWSFSFDDVPRKEDRDERDVIMDICSQEGIECHFSHPGVPDYSKGLFDAIDPPYLNTRFISEGSSFLRSKNCRVVFSGHGGDEGVSHRSNPYELWYHGEYLPVFKHLYHNNAGKKLRLLRTVRHMVLFPKQYGYLRKPFRSVAVNAGRMLTQEFLDRLAPTVEPPTLHFSYDPAAYILQGGHRVRLDNVAVQGAQKHVRYMLPFIDYRVLDFALSIPRAQYNRPGMDRFVYRKAFGDLMPQSLREVNYKDTPSVDDYQPKFDMTAHFRYTKDQILKTLDREFWDGILDFEFLESLSFSEKYDRRDYLLTSKLLNEASICAAIQTAALRAGDWRREA